jgi:PAS domain S-box-containing protein
MEQHKLLQKQINKHLSDFNLEDKTLQNFLQAVNESYLSFERDKEISEHAFSESEKEYYEVNENLKKEYELKKISISNLYKTLETIDNDFEELQNKENLDDLLFISKYLNSQIEKRRESEKNLSTTVELLKTLLANLQSGILVEDENRKIQFTNELFCDFFSIPVAPENLIGMDCSDSAEQSKNLFKDPEHFVLSITNALKNKKIITHERFELVNGTFLERDYIPIFIKEEYKGHLWKYTNITSRIESQKLLEQSEERNRLIMNSSLNAIITIDKKGLISFWNSRAEQMFGWNKSEVIGQPLHDIIIPSVHKENHVRGMNHYLKTGEGPVLNKNLELPAINRDGTEFPIEISIIPIQQNNELFFCSFIQDISERKKAENQLKIQEEKYRNIITNMNLGMLEVDNDEVIKFANQSFCKISGYEIEELIGKKPSNLFVFGENINKIDKKKELRKKGVSDIYQLPIKNKRGELRWWTVSGGPNFDDKGNLIGSIGIHLDITEQKQLEIELEVEKIKALEASKAKEAFLANMSHEIRTPLNAIIGFLRELKKQNISESQHKYIENSTIASKHLLSIINNILDISKIEAGEMTLENEDFDLHKTIENVFNVLEPKTIQKNLIFKTFYDDSLTKYFKGDNVRIEEILFNLVGNSIKFTSEGSITINCRLLKNEASNQTFCISIEDTGIGMESNFINSIFNKFSQEENNKTKKYGGTGLGMSITKQLIDLMNGKISIESEKDKGTKIKIHLTLEKGNRTNIAYETFDSSKINLENKKILLVEDNEFNRIVAQNSLSSINCITTEAENGKEAIEILENNSFDLILMDIQMPIMDGFETTNYIRNVLKLNIPIIALTANAFKTEIDKCKEVGMDDYITKPFNEKSLFETIIKHLNLSIKEGEKINTETKFYNLTHLISLSKNNPEFVNKMLLIFINQAKEIITKTDEAIEQNNFMEVSKLIHKIKPSIEGVGIDSIYNEVRELEKISQTSNNKEKITELFSSIKLTLIKVMEQLEENELN